MKSSSDTTISIAAARRLADAHPTGLASLVPTTDEHDSAMLWRALRDDDAAWIFAGGSAQFAITIDGERHHWTVVP